MPSLALLGGMEAGVRYFRNEWGEQFEAISAAPPFTLVKVEKYGKIARFWAKTQFQVEQEQLRTRTDE
jgi:hypothetical protein